LAASASMARRTVSARSSGRHSIVILPRIALETSSRSSISRVRRRTRRTTIARGSAVARSPPLIRSRTWTALLIVPSAFRSSCPPELAGADVQKRHGERGGDAGSNCAVGCGPCRRYTRARANILCTSHPTAFAEEGDRAAAPRSGFGQPAVWRGQQAGEDCFDRSDTVGRGRVGGWARRRLEPVPGPPSARDCFVVTGRTRSMERVPSSTASGISWRSIQVVT
jgi:hypothetical protein